MRAVKIHFPDQEQMQAFIRKYQLCYVALDIAQHCIRGLLTEKQIIDALYNFEGELTVVKPALSFFM